MFGGSKRFNFQVAPAYHGGRVFSLGSTGRVFAYEAGTGRKLRQVTIPVHEEYEAMRQTLLTSLKAGKWSGVNPERNARKWAARWSWPRPVRTRRCSW